MSHQTRNTRKQYVLRARRRLALEIERNGIYLKANVPAYEPDGMNGYYNVGNKDVKIKGIIVNSSANSTGSEMSTDDAKRLYSDTHNMIILYDPCLRLEYNTIFYTEDNRQYKVVKVENVDNLDLYYQVALKYTNNHMKGYNSNGER